MRITVKNLTKKFGQMAAVSDVSLAIGEGELFTLLGPSGCGKTTLLRLIAGLEDVTAGRIMIDGTNVVGVPTRSTRTCPCAEISASG